MSEMDKERFLKTGLLEQYILGLTNEEESAEVERYAAAFPEIAEEIKSLRHALDQYAMKYTTKPPKELRQRVMRSIDKEIADKKAREVAASPSRKRTPWLLLGLLALVTVFAAVVYQGKVSSEREHQRLISEFAAYRENCATLQQQMADRQEVLALLNHPQTTTVRLTGSTLAPEGMAVAYLNETENAAYLRINNLPPPPDGKTYQLWADVDGHMVNMGVIDYGAEGPFLVTYIDHAESINLTLEPAGGSQEATVEQLYLNGKV